MIFKSIKGIHLRLFTSYPLDSHSAFIFSQRMRHFRIAAKTRIVPVNCSRILCLYLQFFFCLFPHSIQPCIKFLFSSLLSIAISAVVAIVLCTCCIFCAFFYIICKKWSPTHATRFHFLWKLWSGKAEGKKKKEVKCTKKLKEK